MQKEHIKMVVAVVVSIGTFGYLLPWMVAWGQNKKSTGAIAVLNVLLGWTVIGWILALVWATAKD